MALKSVSLRPKAVMLTPMLLLLLLWYLSDMWYVWSSSGQLAGVAEEDDQSHTSMKHLGGMVVEWLRDTADDNPLGDLCEQVRSYVAWRIYPSAPSAQTVTCKTNRKRLSFVPMSIRLLNDKSLGYFFKSDSM